MTIYDPVYVTYTINVPKESWQNREQCILREGDGATMPLAPRKPVKILHGGDLRGWPDNKRPASEKTRRRGGR